MIAVFRPAALAPANRVWLRLGLVLYKVVNPVAMGLVFFATVVPIGLIMRVLGKDPLRLARPRAPRAIGSSGRRPAPRPNP